MISQIKPNPRLETSEVEKIELTQEQLEILEQLKFNQSSTERVKTFAKLADEYGLDAILGLLLPWAGDLATSIMSGFYLLYEGTKSGLSKKEMLKIVCLQGADFAIGAIPVIGNVYDFFFQSNKLSERYFIEKTEELIENARSVGIPESEIAKIKIEAEKLPRCIEKAIEIYKKSPIRRIIQDCSHWMRRTLATNPNV